MAEKSSTVPARRRLTPRLQASRGGRNVLIAVVAATVASQFFRASTSVLGPELIHDLALSPEALGLANAAFFIALVATQIPIGMLFDRYGPRLVVSLLTVLAVAGSLLNAAAEGEAAFIAARLLIGLGSAASFMSAVVLCGRWYGGPLFATMLGRVFALSTIGYLLAGTPWAALTAILGWRRAFVVIAVLAAGTGLLFYALARDAPSGEPAPRRESLRQILAGLAKVWQVPGLFPILALHFVAYAALLTVFGVWAGPYLHDVHGLDSVSRGNVLLAMGLAQMAGTLAFGPLDRRLKRRRVTVAAGAGAAVGALTVLAALAHPAPALAIVILVLFCLASSFNVVNVADVNSRFPRELAGRGATAVNLVQVIGTSLLPIATGAVIGLFPGDGELRPEDAYRTAFAVIALSLAAGLALYTLFYRKPAGG